MEDLKKQYKRNENFVFRKIEDETILVPIRDNVGDLGFIYNLNEVGEFIWEQFDGTNGLLDIKEMILREFEVSSQKAEKDLFEFVSQLKQIEAITLKGLVVFPLEKRSMEKDKKKKYKNPEVTKISLDAKCAVLGFCKAPATIGPGVPMCGLPFAPCYGKGS